MPDVPYSVALVARGAGAYAYTYLGPAGLDAGSLVLVPFKHRLEPGLVVGEDEAPPQMELQPLIALTVSRWPGWGKLLLKLCELTAAAPDQLAGHLLFASASASLRFAVTIEEPELLTADEQAALSPLAGKLNLAKQKALLKNWASAAALAAQGAIEFACNIAGDPDGTRSAASWGRAHQLDAPTAALLGLGASTLPGSYLAGFDGVELKKLKAVKTAAGAVQPANLPTSKWMFEELALPADFEMLRLLPALAEMKLRRGFSTWPQLRQLLPAELAADLAANRNVLVVVPQAWLLERLWPLLAPLAERASRFRAESGPAAASFVLRQLDTGNGHAVLGGPSAWKLAAYGDFDRVILIDPSHPQYAPESTPYLDPRIALLAALIREPRSARRQARITPSGLKNAGLATRAPNPQLDLLEFGMSAIDGAAMEGSRLQILPAFEPSAQAGRTDRADTDPLPLELRRPDRRRLVYFNRLGSSRGLRCMECWASAPCPRCGSARIHFSPAAAQFTCPDCGLNLPELRCPRCGLAALAHDAPGLEAVQRRPGELLLRGSARPAHIPPQTSAVLGTSQLLSPLDFWPQQVVYVHAEARIEPLSNWPDAIDMALRLASLYANPELSEVCIVSTELAGQLGAQFDAAELAQRHAGELGLRRLGGLPPYGTLYALHLIAANSSALNAARAAVGETLAAHEATSLLRLGGAYRRGGAFRSGGWLVNPRITLRELQELRWAVHALDATLTVHAQRGPW